jgi:hypothetical protein
MGRYINVGNNLSYTGPKKIFHTVSSVASSGGSTWTVPEGVTCATFEIWGGGGSGSPSCCCTCWGGDAGYGGAYSLKTLSVTPGSKYTLAVGQGGCGNQCWFNGNACGCCGGTTFVTGTGLTNFCAEGGKGGVWCNAWGYGQASAVACGGDINLQGGQSHKANYCCWSGCGGISAGGESPFGGGLTWSPGGVGAEGVFYNCGYTGTFPGGGSPNRQMYRSGWCDCCSGCTAGGADGLIVITI